MLSLDPPVLVLVHIANKDQVSVPADAATLRGIKTINVIYIKHPPLDQSSSSPPSRPPPPKSTDNLIEAVAMAWGSLLLGCSWTQQNQSFIRIRWIDSPEEKITIN